MVIVELFMAIEDAFGVDFPEDDAQALYEQPVRATRDFVIAQAFPSTTDPDARGWCRTQQAFYCLRGTASRVRVAEASTLRPSDPLEGRVSPHKWVWLRRHLTPRIGPDILPDARRNFIRWPVALPEGLVSFGDVARIIADSGCVVMGCRPPLGPDRTDLPELRVEVGDKLVAIISRELHIPIDKITMESEWFGDLGL